MTSSGRYGSKRQLEPKNVRSHVLLCQLGELRVLSLEYFPTRRILYREP